MIGSIIAIIVMFKFVIYAVSIALALYIVYIVAMLGIYGVIASFRALFGVEMSKEDEIKAKKEEEEREKERDAYMRDMAVKDAMQRRRDKIEKMSNL